MPKRLRRDCRAYGFPAFSWGGSFCRGKRKRRQSTTKMTGRTNNTRHRKDRNQKGRRGWQHHGFWERCATMQGRPC